MVEFAGLLIIFMSEMLTYVRISEHPKIPILEDFLMSILFIKVPTI